MDSQEFIKFIADLPLYQRIEDDGSVEKYFAENTNSKLACFCPECNDYSVFTLKTILFEQYFPHLNLTDKANQRLTSTFQLSCEVNQTHSTIFVFVFKNTYFMKIGQYPSKTSLLQYEVSKYSKALESKQDDYLKAIDTYSNGYGIAGMIYLRRIFESFIKETYLQNKEELQIDVDKFKQLKMEQKVKLLSKYLPRYINENDGIYSILSTAVHKLDEQTCLDIFPKIKMSIDSILIQKLRDIEDKEFETKSKEQIPLIKAEHDIK